MHSEICRELAFVSPRRLLRKVGHPHFPTKPALSLFVAKNDAKLTAFCFRMWREGDISRKGRKAVLQSRRQNESTLVRINTSYL